MFLGKATDAGFQARFALIVGADARDLAVANMHLEQAARPAIIGAGGGDDRFTFFWHFINHGIGLYRAFFAPQRHKVHKEQKKII